MISISVITIIESLFSLLLIYLAQKYFRALKRKEKILSKLELRFNLAVQGSNAGIYDWDISNGKIIHNSIVDEMLGHGKGDESPDLTLEGFMARLHPEDLERVGNAVQKHLQDGLPYETEFRLRRKDGSFIWIYDTALATRDKNGKPTFWVGTMLNISERKKSEEKILLQNEQLTKANKEMDFLMHRLSHDLKAPLSSIMGLASIAEYSKSEAERLQYIKMIGERVNYLNFFIKEIIDYSKSSRKEPTLEKINISILIEEIIKSVYFNEGGDKINFSIKIPQNPFVISDKILLSGIITNLIGNAVKYHDFNKEYKNIEVFVSAVSEDKWKLTVTDNGLGISAAHHSKIFDIFYRASVSANGSGLGLYIVKESVGKLKGTIELQSEVGIGSAFTIVFNQK